MKLFFISIAVLLVAQSALAQFHYGIKGGGSLVNMALKQPGVNNEQHRLSYQAGFYGMQQVTKRVFSRIELLYANKGFQAEASPVTVGGVPDAFSLHLHYLTLPILGGYSPTENFFVVLGPEIGYLIAARSRFGSESNDVSLTWNEPFDIGLVAGIGYRIISKIEIELRYVYGVREVAPDNYRWVDSQDPLNDFQSQNRVFQLSLAYQLN